MGKATYTVTVTNNSNGVSVDYENRDADDFAGARSGG